MEQLLNYLAIIVTMIFVDIGAFYIAWKKLKSTERTDGTQMLKDLQDIADRAVKQQKEATAGWEADRQKFEARISSLEAQLSLLNTGDLRIELIIGGNPKVAKSVKIENVVALPLDGEGAPKISNHNIYKNGK